MLALRKLWNGDLPLETAFWNYAVFGGIVINLVTSAAFLILIAHDLPLAAGIVGYGLSIPYNLVVTVGVWRAAAGDDTDPKKARLYPAIALVGMLILSLI